MKKLLLFVALSLSVATTFAQKGLHVGALFNPNSTWLLNSDDSDNADFRYKSTFGFATGLHIDFHFNDNIGAGIELLGMKQGQNFEDFVGNEFKINLTYIKIPVLFVFNSNPESLVGFQGKVGPAFGILTGSNLLDGDGDEVFQFEDEYKKLAISAVVGLGMVFNITEHFKIDAGLRFDIGLTSPEDKDFFYDDRPHTFALNGGAEIGFYYILPIR